MKSFALTITALCALSSTVVNAAALMKRTYLENSSCKMLCTVPSSPNFLLTFNAHWTSVNNIARFTYIDGFTPAPGSWTGVNGPLPGEAGVYYTKVNVGDANGQWQFTFRLVYRPAHDTLLFELMSDSKVGPNIVTDCGLVCNNMDINKYVEGAAVP
ncbi:uncharacterized protein L969DRAFT_492076 [Mixia osmundae IAM 14324]|uniref:Uncharacterized protein n=1 Tax=Mixia osmundae (strain CBS 9802 / IAM 14324 / JCM 22182 / KY 12970) TaxID=764103 RepID=G7E124_MIXOS|nr:uncharacterized protein L969DRAFT_492076 [Mixia osmundae IAM 14324]KEI38830.1 hypothetical protein L969DRAFT_492076 [Mixia osmundae IAM 14324]GAA96534.1 hypothetical protein E5Q_03202 [Mixia osmundae IAM 14324]